jgi:TP901 family phage tail tape measure protein
MALNALGLGFIFTAQNLASRPISRLNASLKELAATSAVAEAKYKASIRQMRIGTAMLATGGIGIGVINGLSKAYGKFEYSLTAAGAVMNATGQEMNQLKEAAIQAGIATQFSPREAAEGLQALGAAGLNATKAIDVLNPTLGLAAASLGQLGVGEAAANVIGVLNAFGETADMAAKRVDQLVRVTQISNFQARDFSVAISQAAAQAKSADQSFESMLATIGLLRNTNLDASSSATAYREATRRLAGDVGAHKKLEKLKIQVLDKSTNQIRDMASIIADMIPALDKLNAKERNNYLTKILGVRGTKVYNAQLAGYNKLVKEGKVRVGDYAGAHRLMVEELKNSRGAMARNRDALLNTSEGQRILLKGSWETFKVMAGETITPVLVPALRSLTESLNKVIRFIKDMPPDLKNLIGNFTVFGMAGIALVGTLKLLKGAAGFLGLTHAVNNAVTATGALGDSVKGLPPHLAKQHVAMSRMAIWQNRLVNGAQKLANALPLVGVAVIGLGAAYRALTADQRRADEARKRREEAARQIRAEAAKQIAASRKELEKYTTAAKTAAHADAEAARQSQKAAKEKLLAQQKRMMAAIKQGEAARIELLKIENQLAGLMSTADRRAATQRKVELMKQMEKANKLVEINKWSAARIAGTQAERALKGEKDESKRLQLRKIAIAGRVIEQRRLNELLAKATAARAEAQQSGMGELAKYQSEKIAMLNAKIRTSHNMASKMAGAYGLKGKRATALVMQFAKGELSKVSRRGEEAEFFKSVMRVKGVEDLKQMRAQDPAKFKRFAEWAWQSRALEARIGGRKHGTRTFLEAGGQEMWAMLREARGELPPGAIAARGKMETGAPVAPAIAMRGKLESTRTEALAQRVRQGEQQNKELREIKSAINRQTAALADIGKPTLVMDGKEVGRSVSGRETDSGRQQDDTSGAGEAVGLGG